MLKASFETICLSFSLAVNLHSYPFKHLLTASSLLVLLLNSFLVSAPHKHLLGKIKLLLFFFLFDLSIETTCGITSPALCIIIVSPILISFLLISSSLCSVALDTTTPPTVTGSTFATGVIAPVLPTWIIIFLIRVSAFSAENLYAIAHLGELDVLPNLFCKFKSLILYTSPSIS